MQEEKDKQIQHLARENQQLSKTVERLKDHLAEAEDRLGNMKLQVSVKEVRMTSYPAVHIQLISLLCTESWCIYLLSLAGLCTCTYSPQCVK